MTTIANSRQDTYAFPTDEERWQALMRRDPAADGAFYYSVRTTGVYCRPSCAARLARRENVRFHASCEEAEQAGFRPCKRCKPNELALADRQAVAVAKACRAIEQAEQMPNLDELADIAGMSRFHFHRVFKALIGVTPKAYADRLRVQRTREELKQSSSVTEAIYGGGYGSSGRFYAGTAAALGMTPTRFRAGGSGEEIRFAIGACRLGAILVAATGMGICAILLGDDPHQLVRDVQDQFPNAQLIGGDRDFEQIVAQVIAFVEAPDQEFKLPLDIHGTAFQQRVWEALRRIPAGSTASYAEIAKQLGHPNAARAVAQACASNAVAVAIPCHRVVRTDGSLSGYRWGIERKRALLDSERSE